MAYNDIPLSLPGFIALDWSLLVFALGFVIVRLFLRQRVKATSLAVNLSDAFIVCSWLSALVLIVVNTWKNSLRQQYVDWPAESLFYSVPFSQAGYVLKVSFLSFFWIYIALWCSKAAFLAFYWELFSLQGRRIRIVIWAASAFTFCTFLVQVLILGLWCDPISGNWDTTGHICSAVQDIHAVTIMTVTNIATDVILLAIPISMLAVKRLGRMELSGIFFIFLIGSLSILVALARFVLLKVVDKYDGASVTHSIDVLSLIEIVASIIAVCLPSFRLFLRKYRETFRSSISSVPRSGSSRCSVRSFDPKRSGEPITLDLVYLPKRSTPKHDIYELPSPMSDFEADYATG